MGKYLLLVLFAITACTPILAPEERGIELQDCTGKDDCNPFEDHILGVYNQDKALFTAQYTVEDHYGHHFGSLWADAVVYWGDTTCPRNGQYMMMHEDECYYGLMWSCEEIYVALSNKGPENTCGSALLHEFGHCMYMEMKTFDGNGNAAHDDDEFWSLIAEANLLSCNRSWVTLEEIEEEMYKMKSQHINQFNSQH
jgi:hypothetical protein